MTIQLVTGQPGVRAANRAEGRIVFRDAQFTGFFSGGRLIDGTLSRDAGNTGDVDVLRAGKLMGKVTTGGKYRPSIIGLSTAAYADNDTTITVSVATAVEVARLKAAGGGGNLSLKFTGPPTAAGTVAATALTVTAVDTTAGTLTVGDLNLNKVVGSLITPADGSESPITLIPDGYGLKVTDAFGVSQDQEYPVIPLAGVITEANVIDWPADASTRAFLRALLSTATGGKYVFDSVFLP